MFANCSHLSMPSLILLYTVMRANQDQKVFQTTCGMHWPEHAAVVGTLVLHTKKDCFLMIASQLIKL